MCICKCMCVWGFFGTYRCYSAADDDSATGQSSGRRALALMLGTGTSGGSLLVVVGWNCGVEHGLGTQALPSLAQSTSPKTCREGTRSLRIRVRIWTRACSLTFMIRKPEQIGDVLYVLGAISRLLLAYAVGPKCAIEYRQASSLDRQNGRKGTTKGPGGQRE